MPELIYSGRVTSGFGSLDWGITGLTLLPTETGGFLFATNGPRGGVTVYSLGSGPVTLADHAYFDIAWSSDVLPEPRVLDVSGTPRIAVAAGGESGIRTFTPDSAGQLGNATLLSEIAPDTGPAATAQPATVVTAPRRSRAATSRPPRRRRPTTTTTRPAARPGPPRRASSRPRSPRRRRTRTRRTRRTTRTSANPTPGTTTSTST